MRGGLVIDARSGESLVRHGRTVWLYVVTGVRGITVTSRQQRENGDPVNAPAMPVPTCTPGFPSMLPPLNADGQMFPEVTGGPRRHAAGLPV